MDIGGGGTKYHPPEVDARLADFGLDQSAIWSALQRGLDYLAGRTELNASGATGIGAWDAITRGLGEEVHPLRWGRLEVNFLPLTVHPNGKLAIIVRKGDENTGLAHRTPTNTSPLRKMTQRVIDDNSIALGLQGHFGLLEEDWKIPELLTTYFLLHRIDVGFGDIHAELSLPIASSDGFITKWHERIILTPQEDQDSIWEKDVGPDPDFPVEMKGMD